MRTTLVPGTALALYFKFRKRKTQENLLKFVKIVRNKSLESKKIFQINIHFKNGTYDTVWKVLGTYQT